MLKYFFQYTLLTELREIIAMEDRSRFDELVYNRPDPLRGTVPTTAPGRGDPREHDYRHSRVSFFTMISV